MTLYLCGPCALFDELGEEHFLRSLKFAVLRNVPGSFVKCWRKRVALDCEDFSGFLVELLRIVSRDGFGRLAGQKYLGSKLVEVSFQNFRDCQIQITFLNSSMSSMQYRHRYPAFERVWKTLRRLNRRHSGGQDAASRKCHPGRHRRVAAKLPI